MMQAIIIDDEKNNVDNLQQLLKKHCAEVQVVATAHYADSALLLIKEWQPDLLFLDIQMPGKSGFDLLRLLPDYTFEVIFVTAYDKYGIQAVKFAAIDYLLKPIDTDELQKAVNRALKKYRHKSQNLQLHNLLHLLQHNQNKEEHRLALPTLKETRFVYPSNILYCESSNNYTTFYFDKEEKLVVSKPIYEYEELLKPYGFARCHQSFLVNIKHIKSWVKEDGGYMLLQSGQQIPVSKSKRETLLKVLANV